MLGLKRDIDKERVLFGRTDGPTDGHILSDQRKLYTQLGKGIADHYRPRDVVYDLLNRDSTRRTHVSRVSAMSITRADGRYADASPERIRRFHAVSSTRPERAGTRTRRKWRQRRRRQRQRKWRMRRQSGKRAKQRRCCVDGRNKGRQTEKQLSFVALICISPL